MTLRQRPVLTRLIVATAALCGAGCLHAAAASAASAAPSAFTGPLSALAATSVTLTGTVNPNGEATTWLFAYGTTSSYGSLTVSESAGSGTANAAVSAVLSGLTPDTLYYYSLEATNAAGTTDGASGLFMTPPSTSAASAPATDLTSTSATLAGTVDPAGAATSYDFQYGTTTAYGQTTPITSAGSGSAAVSVTAPISGLNPGTTYHFRVVATSGSQTIDGADETFTTTAGVAPQAQTGSAEAPGATTVTLTGSVNPEGAATTWVFQYGTTSAYGLTTATQSAGSGKTTTSVTSALTKLQPDTIYHYRIVATNDGGSADGEDVTFTTPPAVTLFAAGTDTIDGRDVQLSGVAAGAGAGTRVTILARPWGNSAYVAVASVSTAANGSWTYRAAPTITTDYRANAPTGSSVTVVLQVSPAITLRRISGSRLLIRVITSRTLDAKIVELQRLAADGRWSPVRSAALDARGSAVVPQSVLPAGTSTIRVTMTAAQAGSGYAAGYSRTLVGVTR